MALYFHSNPLSALDGIDEFFNRLKRIDAIMFCGVLLAACHFPIGLAGCFSSEESIRFLFDNIALSACG